MRHYLLLNIILISSFSLAQNSFMRTFNMGGMQGGLYLEKTSDGGFIGTGQHEGNGSHGSCDTYLYRVDECGNQIFYGLYGTGTAEGGHAVRETSDGGYIVSVGHDPAILLKVDVNGNPQFYKQYGGVSEITNTIETSSGGFMSIGFAGGNLGVMKTDGTGNVEFIKAINMGANDRAFSIEELPNGDFILFSISENSHDACVTRINDTALVIWSTCVGTGSGNLLNSVWAAPGMVDTTDNSIVVASNTLLNTVGGERNILLTKMDWDGNVLWSKTFAGASNDFPKGIDYGLNGGYIVSGSTQSFNQPDLNQISDVGFMPRSGPKQALAARDIFLLETDNNGNALWGKAIGGSGDEVAKGVKQSNNGYIISAFAGSSFFNAGDFDALFIRTDSVGNVGCQGYDVTFVETVANPSIDNTYTTSILSTSGVDIPLGFQQITVDDYFVCATCYTEPKFSISDTTVCVGDTVIFTNTTTVGLTCFQDWINNGTDTIPGITSKEIKLVYDSPGTYPVKLVSSSQCLDTNFFQVNIHVSEPIIDDIVLTGLNGFEVSCFGAMDGQSSISASGGAGTLSYSIDSISFVNSNVFQNLDTGHYIAYVKDSNGCIDDSTFIITQPTKLVVNSIVDSVNCFGYADGSMSIISSGGVYPYSYTWSPNPNNDTDSILNNVPKGTYTGYITDQNNCIDSVISTIEEPSKVIVSMSFLNTCIDQNVLLQPSFSGGTGLLTVHWNNDSTVVQNILDATPLRDTVYHVFVMDNHLCSSDTLSIEVNLNPRFEIQSLPISGCQPFDAVIYYNLNQIEDNIATCKWNLGDGVNIANQCDSIYHTYTDYGFFTLQATLISDKDCQTTQISNNHTEVYPRAEANFEISPNQVSILFPRVEFTNTSNIATSFDWTINDSVIYNYNVPGFNYMVSVSQPGDYEVCLLAKTPENCNDSICKYVTVFDEFHLFVPNSFTPNGDGFNDFFKPIINQDLLSTYNFLIYDKWGQLIYNTNNTDDAWDGRFNGVLLQNDTYVWKIEVNAVIRGVVKTITRTGFVQIIK